MIRSKFLIHRVELKVVSKSSGALFGLAFLIHRVELKEQINNILDQTTQQFLIHRVELKERLNIIIPQKREIVSNSPCGVERLAVSFGKSQKRRRF